MIWRHITTATFTLCLMALFSSCHDEQIPKNVIDSATMADFLVEAHLIDSYDYVLVSHGREAADTIVSAAYDSLFLKYNISLADYDTSIAYYTRHPQMLEDIYSRVAQRLREEANNPALKNIN